MKIPGESEPELYIEEVKRTTADWAGEVHPMLLSFLQPAEKECVMDLVGLARRQRDSTVPMKPPLEVLAEGGHVLYLCAGAEGLSTLRLGAEHFVRPLRRNLFKFAKLTPIVIMAPLVPSDWDLVTSYPEVYFLEGTPSSQFDLERACIKTAAHIFVSQVGAVGSTSLTSWTVDAEVICVARLLDAQLPPDVKVVVDVQSDTSHHFMTQRSARAGLGKRRLSQLERATKASGGGAVDPFGDTSGKMDSDYYRSELFCAGKMFVGTAVTSLAINTFYNPSLHELVMTMLKSKISSVNVPRKWIGRPYRELFEKLLWGEQLLPVGLYRQGGSGGGPSYLFAAPSTSATELERTDQIICFGQKPLNA